MEPRKTLDLTVRTREGIIAMARTSAELWFPSCVREIEGGGIEASFPPGFLDQETQREKFVSLAGNVPGLADQIRSRLEAEGMTRGAIGALSIELIPDQSAAVPAADPLGAATRLRESLS